MCGIAAIFCDRPQEGLSSLIEGMLTAIAHRGPDGRGSLFGAGPDLVDHPQAAADWALGHVRLAIIDLSDSGLQPMTRAQERAWIAYNGEIYNYLEIREELQREGFTFATKTDTEVVLAAYRHWGVDCVEKFTGMFALLILDLQNQCAFAARDRLGIKPLYFWRGTHRVVVVSEPKQLLTLAEYSPIANRQMIVDYLTQGLLGHEPTQSCFQGVHPLPPGTRLSWALGKLPDITHAERWWTPSTETVPVSWSEVVDRTGELFRRAVRLRLRSDVPVGTCLSGGIDSSSIVGVCQRELDTHMKTFSICNQVTTIDESPYIDAVNAHCGSESVKDAVTVDQLIGEIDDLIYMQDEPVYSASQYAEYRLMRKARQSGVTVLLNGQGGDEAMCGYRKYFYFYLRDLLRKARFGSAINHLWQSLWHGDKQLFQLWQGKRYLPKLKKQDDYDQLLQPDWKSLRRNAWAQRMRRNSQMRDHQWADLIYWSLPVLLRYQDRNSMAFSIESRVPFVDHQFLEHCLTVPGSFFFRRGMTKRMLVDAMGNTLPEMVRQRRTKLGFDTPQAIWMRQELGTLLENRVRQSKALAEIIKQDVAIGLFTEMRNNPRTRDHFRLFRVACLAIWLERFEVNFSN